MNGWALDSNNPIAYLESIIEGVGYEYNTDYTEIINELLAAQVDTESGLHTMTLTEFVDYTNQLHDLIINQDLAIPIYEYE